MDAGDFSVHIVLATGNVGKVNDFKLLFDAAAVPVKLESMCAYGGMPEVDESESTFAGNARLKALAARAQLPADDGLWVLADDSGLSVDALQGAPGVQSARYAGEGATDASNRQKLLSELDGVEGPKRTAFFTCHLCLLAADGTCFDFVGKRSGFIAEAARGSNGFGYDPLFIPEGENRTWGELPERVKNEDSHRGRAIALLLEWWVRRALPR